MNFGELKFLLKHSSVYGLGSIIGQAIGFLLLPLYTRYLTPADYGVMALVDVARWIVGLIISLGIINALSRFYYEYEEQEKRNLVISSAYWIAVIVLIVFAPLLHYLSPYLSLFIFHSKEYSSIFSVALLSLLFGLITNIGMDYLRIRAQSIKYVKVTLIRMVFLISCNIFFVVHLETGVIGVFYASLLSSIIFSIVLAIIVLRQVGYGFSSSISKEMIIFAFPLIFSSIFRGIINESDKLFINFFFSPFETGLYSIAQKVGTAIHSLVTSPFLQTYLPRRFQIMNQDNAKEEYAHILIYYLVAICSIGLLVSMLADEIMVIMTTDEYYAAAKYIPAIVLSMIIFGMKYHFETGIAIMKKTKYIAYVNGIAMVANIGLNWILIKKFGIAGAIISMNCSYLVTTLLSLLFSQKLYPVPFDYRKILSVFLAGIFVFSLSLMIPGYSLVIKIIVKLILFFVFLGLVFFLKVLPREILGKIRLMIPVGL